MKSDQFFIPYHYTHKEMLLSSAATIMFNALSRNNIPIVKLGELIEKPQYGFTAQSTSSPIGPKYLRITDIKSGEVKWDNVPCCECSRIDNYLLKSGDILFARTGGTTGKTFIVTNCPKSVFASYLIRVRPKRNNYSEYLYWFFQSKKYWDQITKGKRGSAQPNVNARKLANILIPSVSKEMQIALSKWLTEYRKKQNGREFTEISLPPPIDKQRRIVAKLDGILGKLAEARRLRGDVIENIDTMLLNRFGQYLEKNTVLYKRLTIGELSVDIKPGFACGAKSDTLGFPHLRMNNISADGSIDLSLLWRAPEYPKNVAKYFLEAGVVLFNNTNGLDLVGKTAIFDLQEKGYVFSNHITRITVNPTLLNPNYLAFYLNYLRYTGYFREICTTWIGQSSINTKKLKQIKILVPGLELQYQIVTKLKDLKSQIVNLQSHQSATTKELDALGSTILEKAFRGELVT